VQSALNVNSGFLFPKLEYHN